MISGLLQPALLTLLVLLPLLINGYPIFFNDSGAYLQAFTGMASFDHPLVDRPIFYSAYLYAFRTLFHTNAAAVLFQGVVFAYVATRCSRLGGQSGVRSWLPLFLILPFSYLAVMASTLMPDIWMPSALLAAYLIFNEPGPRKCFYFVVIATSVAFAPANGVIIALSVAGFFAIVLIAKVRLPKKWINLCIVVLAVLFGQGAVSLSNHYAFKVYSPIVSGSAFLYATLTRENLADDALSRECAATGAGNSICRNLPDYRNLSGNTLLWGEKWKRPIWNPENQDFLSKVNRRILAAHPAKAAAYFLKNSLTALTLFPANLDQLYSVKYNTVAGPATWLNNYGDMARFSQSMQQTRRNVFGYLKLYRLLLGALFLATIWLAIRNRLHANPAFLGFFVFGLLFTIANAAITGGLSLPDYRLNVRAVDIFVVMLFCLACGSNPSPASQVGAETPQA